MARSTATRSTCEDIRIDRYQTIAEVNAGLQGDRSINMRMASMRNLRGWAEAQTCVQACT